MPRVDDLRPLPPGLGEKFLAVGKCVACGGTGLSSRGKSCWPCEGTGRTRPSRTGKPPKEDRK